MGNKGSSAAAGAAAPPCTLTGLYSSCEWDARTIRRLVLQRKLAPLYPGRSEQQEDDAAAVACSTGEDSTNNSGDGGCLEECPICFLFYPGGLNRATCCRKGLCTECYLQIVKPSTVRSATAAAGVPCPFCNRPGFAVVFTGPLSVSQRKAELSEAQLTIQAQIAAIQQQQQQPQPQISAAGRTSESGSALAATASSPLRPAPPAAPAAAAPFPHLSTPAARAQGRTAAAAAETGRDGGGERGEGGQRQQQQQQQQQQQHIGRRQLSEDPWLLDTLKLCLADFAVDTDGLSPLEIAQLYEALVSSTVQASNNAGVFLPGDESLLLPDSLSTSEPVQSLSGSASSSYPSSSDVMRHSAPHATAAATKPAATTVRTSSSSSSPSPSSSSSSAVAAQQRVSVGSDDVTELSSSDDSDLLLALELSRQTLPV